MKPFTLTWLLLLIGIVSCFAQLRIVCIGNSITQGKAGLKPDSTFEYSYRPWLWERLTNDGYSVDMVGYHPHFFDEKPDFMLNFPSKSGKPFDRDCEAYYGIRSDGFLKGTKSSHWTGKPLPPFRERINDPQRGYTPDVALIHIGTNDPDSTAALVSVTKSNIIAIIGVLREKNPDVQIFLAKLITGWKKINLEIDNICREVSSKQSPVIAVDLTTGFINNPKLPGSMTYDHVHPNTAGQLFMAQRWHEAITTRLVDRVKPKLQGLVNIDKKPNELTITWQSATDNFGVKEYLLKDGTTIVARVAYDKNSITLPGSVPGVKKFQFVAKDFAGNESSARVIKLRGR